MKIMRYADQPVTLWRNGCGELREMVCRPSHGEPGFDWRISVATITADGAFSYYPGIDRSLVKLDGGALTLTVDGVQRRMEDGQLCTFDGESVVTSAIAGQPVRVLNVMTRRSTFSHEWGINKHANPATAMLAQIIAVALKPMVLSNQKLKIGDVIVPNDDEFRGDLSGLAMVSLIAHSPASKLHMANL